MATFTNIPDTDLDADSPITENVMLALRDNTLAIAQGDATAPRIQKEALGSATVGAYLLKTSQATAGALTASAGSLGTVYTSIPAGWYTYNIGIATQDISTHTVGIQVYVNAAWRTIGTYSGASTSQISTNIGGTIISTGSNVRLFATNQVSGKLVTAYFNYTKLDQ